MCSVDFRIKKIKQNKNKEVTKTVRVEMSRMILVMKTFLDFTVPVSLTL